MLKVAKEISTMLNWRGCAKVYRLRPHYSLREPVFLHFRCKPVLCFNRFGQSWYRDIEELEYVICSSVIAMSGPETLIFPAELIWSGPHQIKFHPISMLEVIGVRKTLNHQDAFDRLDYHCLFAGMK